MYYLEKIESNIIELTNIHVKPQKPHLKIYEILENWFFPSLQSLLQKWTINNRAFTRKHLYFYVFISRKWRIKAMSYQFGHINIKMNFIKISGITFMIWLKTNGFIPPKMMLVTSICFWWVKFLFLFNKYFDFNIAWNFSTQSCCM